jgi:heavy metal sensor kinase
MVAVLAVCYLFLEGSLRKRMDSDLAEEVVEYAALLQSQNLQVLEDVLEREAFSEGTDQVFFRILDRAGNILITTDTSSWHDLMNGGTHLQAALTGKPVFVDYYDRERDFHARLLYGVIADNMILEQGESQEGNRALLSQFRRVFMIATLAFVCCSLLAGAYMARSSLAGVQRLTQAAVKITEGRWDHRVPVSRNHDEIDELANAFNTMVDRIQVLFRELREVTDDIAHDLRTPLMRIRGEAEMALAESEADAMGHERCGSVLEECDRMLSLINTMLEISQTEAGAKSMERTEVDLAAAVEDVCELFRPAAEDKGLNLQFTASPAPSVLGDSQRLKRAMAHLIDNAIKYTDSGGQVRVQCESQQGEVVVMVSDTGIGIPGDAATEVFGRFYRVDTSRSEPGNGLGLSLAQAIVRAHGGQIGLESEVGRGSVFTVRIPAVRSHR